MRSLVLSFAFLGMSVFGSAVSSAQSDAAADLKPEDVEEIVRNYILENPGIVVEAIQLWRQEQQLAQMLPKIEAFRDYLERDATYPVLGNPDGDVTIVEFFDYRCGFCKRHYPVIQDLLEKDGNIRYVARQFPIRDEEGQKPLSYLAATAALAAHKQKLYGPFHGALMTDTQALTEARMYQLAESVGLNIQQLKADMQDDAIKTTIQNTLSVGREIGFNGTPSYFVGEEVVIGALGKGAMSDAVAKTREKAAQSGTGR